MKTPRVSVVIPAYNAQEFLHDAIASVLAQTFTDFELLVVDDGSIDSTVEIARSCRDPRIQVIESGVNRGPAAAQNIGLQNARGEYIALLGADDLALSTRLERQVAFFDANSEIALVGTAYWTLVPSGKLDLVCVPIDQIAIRWRLLFGNPIAAPSVLMRRSILKTVGYFDETIHFGEDMDLWGRIAEAGAIAQLAEPLVKYRVHLKSLTRSIGEQRTRWQIEIIKRNVARLSGLCVSDQVVESLACLKPNVSQLAVSEAFDVVWQCVCVFCSSVVQTSRTRHLLFQEMLDNLLRLARQDESQRLRALEIAYRYIIHYAPSQIATPLFWNFAAKVISSSSWRRAFRRIVPRKSNA